MSVSRLDQLYRRLLLSKFFTKGWGKPDNLKRIFAFRKLIGDREKCKHLVAADYPINIDKEYVDGDCRVVEGHFLSPFVHHLPGIMPKEVEVANFQMLLPVKWKHPTYRPVCVHLAGTGDHFFWRRRLLTARPLLKEAGIASIILENPYYGARKPKDQLRSSLHNVSDLFVMGGALVLESMALFHWCERQGFGPLGISGVSMGGHMASLAATNWTKPIPLIPILSWSTASCVFTKGVLSGSIPWHTLQEQFFNNNVYQKELKKLLVSPEEKLRAYEIGQQFAKDYSRDLSVLISGGTRDITADPLSRHQTPASPVQLEGSIDSATISQTPASTSSIQNINNSITEAPPFSFQQGLQDLANDNSASISQASTPPPPKIIASSHVNQKTTTSHGGQGDGPNFATTFPVSSKEYVIQDSRSADQPFGSDQSLQGDLSSSKDHSRPEIPENPAFQASDQPVTMSSGITPTSLPTPPSSSSSSTQVSGKTSRKQQWAKSPASLSLSYAHAKTQSGSKTPGSNPTQSSSGKSVGTTTKSDNNPLTIKHALAKSNLVSRKSRPMLPQDETALKNLETEALDFMRGVMDECTHLGNFSVPVDPELIIIVLAKQDAYIPRDRVLGLDQLWPGCELRYIDQGHVGAVLFNQAVFRKAIVDAFEKQAKKYGHESSPSALFPNLRKAS